MLECTGCMGSCKDMHLDGWIIATCLRLSVFKIMCKYLSIHALREKDLPLCSISPVLEGVVHDGLQHQPVTDVRRAAKMEHVYAPKGRVSVTQAAGLDGG